MSRIYIYIYIYWERKRKRDKSNFIHLRTIYSSSVCLSLSSPCLFYISTDNGKIKFEGKISHFWLQSDFILHHHHPSSSIILSIILHHPTSSYIVLLHSPYPSSISPSIINLFSILLPIYPKRSETAK